MQSSKEKLEHQHPPKESSFYVHKVSGPGLTTATVNHPTRVLIDLDDSSGRSCSQKLSIHANLKLVSKARPTIASLSLFS